MTRPQRLQEPAGRVIRHTDPAGVEKPPARRQNGDDVPGNAAAVEVYETLADECGLATARKVLAILDGYAPKLAQIDRLMARRRLPDLMAKRPGLSTRALARLLGVTHSSVRRWLRESGTAYRTRSTEAG